MFQLNGLHADPEPEPRSSLERDVRSLHAIAIWPINCEVLICNYIH